ncbi:MAG: hypothetical protein Kow0069_33430 [Promethearchaeota archaeon]
MTERTERNPFFTLIFAKLNMRPFQYGFSCEFLPAADVLELGVPEAMKEHQFGLFLKVFDEDLNDDLAALLGALRGLDAYEQFFPWPLLKVEDGYYPNELTVEKFSKQVAKLLDWLAARGFDPPPYVLVDLEPSADPADAQKAEAVRADQLRALRKRLKREVESAAKEARAPGGAVGGGSGGGEAGGFDAMAFVGKLVDMIDENMDEERFEESSRKFDALVEQMHERGTKALAVALPWTFEDLADGRHLVQDFMTTPIQTVNWDAINYMVFSTDFVNRTRGVVTHDDFCHLVHSWAKDFAAHHGQERASICFGITNYGVQDVSAVQTDPELYRREFDAAIAGGINQLGIYALEGVYASHDDPSRFFEVVGSASGKFEPEPDKLDFASMIRRLFRALDFVAPVLKYLVDSGKVMRIIQAVTGGGLL